jgi:rfaE bifunctional protein kinase chain/domain
MHKRLEKVVRSFRGKRVVVIGDIVADEFVYGRTYRLSREAPVPIVRFDHSDIRLGGAANVVNNLFAMGGRAVPIGVIGVDAPGREILSLFAQAGADTGCIIRDKNRSTITKTRILAGDIGTVAQQMLRLDRGSNGDLGNRLRRTLIDSFVSAARSADAVIFSDYGEGVLPDHVRDELLACARKQGALTVADSRFKIHMFRGVTAVTPNVPELSQYAKKFIEGEDDIARAAGSLQRRTGCRGVLVKRGSMGMVLCRRGRGVMAIPPYGSVEVADVTGAGDTVIAAFALALCGGGTMEEAARLANIAGGIKVTKRGTATVAAVELLHGVEVSLRGDLQST